MFDDTRKELRKLEQQLLEQERAGDGFEDFYRDILEESGTDEDQTVPTQRRQPAKRGSYGDTPRAIAAPRKKGIKGPLLIVMLELIGIAALAFYWIEQVF